VLFYDLAKALFKFMHKHFWENNQKKNYNLCWDVSFNLVICFLYSPREPNKFQKFMYILTSDFIVCLVPLQIRFYVGTLYFY